MRAFVIGNATIDDTFVLPRMPDAGETLLATESRRDIGGKGANQAVLLARAAIPVRFVARIGADAEAILVRAALAAEGLASGLIETILPTDRSIILLSADGENRIVSTAHCARAMTQADAEAALSAARRGDLLLMQGNLAARLTAHAFAAARRRGLTTVLNPAPADAEFAALWPLADLVVLNQAEAAQLTGVPEPKHAARRIRGAGARAVVVTLGASGALMLDENGITATPAAPAAVADTTGAGDTFVAIFCAARFARRLSAEDALHAAAHAAAITVSRPGALSAFPTAPELAAILGIT